MNEPTPPQQRLNRTFIGSVLFIDIVGYSTRTVPDQLELKQVFNTLVADAVRHLAASERIMVDTGDGAGIAFLGDPEDALFAALAVKDAIDSGKIWLGEPGFARMGINLGPLKLVRDINGHTNMIGDGVNDAQRVMSFAEPGQVMVSHSYYDIISRFSHDYAQLFNYEGTRQDKHVREHAVYRFGSADGNESLAEKLRDRLRARHLGADEPVTTAHGWSVSGRKEHAAQGSAKNAGMPRPALVATLVGAASLVGAVWSWSGTPQRQPVSASAAAPVAVPLPQPQPPGATNKDTPDREAPAKAVEVAPVPAQPAPEAQAAPKAMPAPEKKTTAAGKPAAAKSATDGRAPSPKPGTVRLAIQPWGEVYVDGGKRGVSPPMKSLSLAPGKHRIEVRNGQFAPFRQTVEVKSGGEATVHYTF